MPYHLWMGNIVNIATDAIVNAANTELKRTPGICEAIFAAADSAKLEEACRRHGHCPIGQSVMTPSFGLPARYIIHVAGPGWFGGAERERLLLADCYRRAMTRAVTSGCKSIAFPLIFSGEYHIPREEAIYIAGQAITDFIRRSPALDVVLVLYKPGIYLMAKRILGWDDTHSYETSAK